MSLYCTLNSLHLVGKKRRKKRSKQKQMDDKTFQTKRTHGQ